MTGEGKPCPTKDCDRTVPDAIWAKAVEDGRPLRCARDRGGCGVLYHPHERDVCEPFHGGADTSREAFESVKPTTRARIRGAILDLIRSKAAGATCDEIEVSLGLSHQTASARVRELRGDGLIFDTGNRRPTRSGRKARVYQAA